jgi:hypothetical protein
MALRGCRESLPSLAPHGSAPWDEGGDEAVRQRLGREAEAEPQMDSRKCLYFSTRKEDKQGFFFFFFFELSGQFCILSSTE